MDMISNIKQKPRSAAVVFFSLFLCQCMNMDKCLTTLSVFGSPTARHCHYVFIVMVWQLSTVDSLNYFFILLTLKTRVVMISQFGTQLTV